MVYAPWQLLQQMEPYEAELREAQTHRGGWLRRRTEREGAVQVVGLPCAQAVGVRGKCFHRWWHRRKECSPWVLGEVLQSFATQAAWHGTERGRYFHPRRAGVRVGLWAA